MIKEQLTILGTKNLLASVQYISINKLRTTLFMYANMMC